MCFKFCVDWWRGKKKVVDKGLLEKYSNDFLYQAVFKAAEGKGFDHFLHRVNILFVVRGDISLTILKKIYGVNDENS